MKTPTTSPSRPRWSRGGTYLIALAVGWGGVTAWHSYEGGDLARPATHGTGRQQTAPRTPEEMLAALVAVQEKADDLEKSSPVYDGDERQLAEIVRLDKSLPPVDDPAATAIDALESHKGDWFRNPGYLTGNRSSDGFPITPASSNLTAGEDDPALFGRWTTTATRFYQWLKLDETAALAYMRRWEEPRYYPPPIVDIALKVWLGKLSRERQLAVLELFSNGVRNSLVSIVTTMVGKAGDVETASWFVDHLRADARQAPFADDWAERVAREWPVESIGTLFEHAVKSGDRETVKDALSRMRPDALCKALGTLVQTDAGRALLKENRGYSFIGTIFNNPAISADDRVDLMRRVEEAIADGKTETSEVIRKAESEDPDRMAKQKSILDRFASGELDLSQAREALVALSPWTESAHPEQAMKEEAEKLLASADPVRALALLDGLPPDERHLQAVRNGWDVAHAFSPERFLAYQQAVPFDPATDRIEDRIKQWGEIVVQADSDWYRQWLVALPPGLDRDLAVAGAAEKIAPGEPHAAAALRARITNPAALK